MDGSGDDLASCGGHERLCPVDGTGRRLEQQADRGRRGNEWPGFVDACLERQRLATSTLGISDTVDAVTNLEIAAAVESKSGEGLAVYQKNAATTELQLKTCSTATGWS